MPEPVTALEYQEAQRAEWGTYVAAQPIDIEGARAFNVGDPVPVSHVGRIVAEDQVKKTTTKAGQALVAGDSDKPKG